MRKDIDCMMVVEGPLAGAKREAVRIGEEMNEVLDRELKVMVSDKTLLHLEDQAYAREY